MPLEEYRRKRDFAVTPEPAGSEAAGSPGPSAVFVVHKHASRALHYDLRLEIGGALASWAVPKGPSLDTHDKHLAVHVEDHPLEYGAFEGTIPAGEYGAGTVMIWDRGEFLPVGEPAAAVEAGQLKFILHGAKLHGAFVLVRMKPRPGEKRENWLLIKERDDEVRPRAEYDVLAAEPDSAVTGRTMEQIAAGGDVWESRAAGEAPAADPPAPPAAARRPRAPRGASPGPMPEGVPFQLATLVDEAPEGPEWIHEVKYDGYRLRIELDGGRGRVVTRNGADWTDRFAPLARAAEALPARSALIDGEAVVLDSEGRSDFGSLQEALAAKHPGDIVLEAFDLLFLDGFDLRAEPLARRKELLRSLLEAGPAGSPLMFTDHFTGDGPAFHASACKMLLEGSVSKRGDRPWVPGRSRDWLKIKCLARQEFVVGGWTDPAGSRADFGALLLGVYDAQGSLRYAGRVGTGFTESTLADLKARLDARATDTPPFSAPPRLKTAHWVRPELVAQVAFREWTRDGVVRQPSFQGLREDADPASVTRETPAADADPPTATAAAKKAKTLPVVAGIAISNPDKVLEPAGVSKLALATYYGQVADAMLPHLAGRFITAVRCPHGSDGGGCFYQKHPEMRGWPRTLRRAPVRERDGTTPDYFFVDDVAGLVSLAQLGVLEIHTWNSLAADYDRPDRIVLDLDPGPDLDWPGVVAAAVTLRDALGALGLAGFAKTTGGRGLHVVVPIVPEHGYDPVRDFAHAFCERLATGAPDTFTAKMSKALRPGRVFIDYLRNAHGATAVCAFSTRARPGATVSVPVAWPGLAKLDPASFTVSTVPRRLAALRTDPWKGYEEARRRLEPALFDSVEAPVP